MSDIGPSKIDAFMTPTSDERRRVAERLRYEGVA